MENEVEVSTACGLTFVYSLEAGHKETVRLRSIRVDKAHQGAGVREGTTYTVSCGFREAEGLDRYFVPPCLQSVSKEARSRLAQRNIVAKLEGTCLKSKREEREV